MLCRSPEWLFGPIEVPSILVARTIVCLVAIFVELIGAVTNKGSQKQFH